MSEAPRRERKRAIARRHIADTAARLFGERGFENVAVSEVARAADVAEQTVYNHFRTKERLVTDRGDEIEDHLCRLIRDRGEALTPAAAIRDYVLDYVDSIRTTPDDVWRGELAHLAAQSPTVRRVALEILAHQAHAMAAAISESGQVAPGTARLQGIALAGVYQIMIEEAGTRTRDGQSQAQIADDLRPLISSLLDELDRWFGGAHPRPRTPPPR